MIHNPDVAAYLYVVFLNRRMTHITYILKHQHQQVQSIFQNNYSREIRHKDDETSSKRVDTKARKAKRWGVILGTLGRQGSPAILKHVESVLKKRNMPYFVILMSEIFPERLKRFGKEVDAWIQIACPRLSIDWGHHFSKPLLSAYEFEVTMKESEWRERYPMIIIPGRRKVEFTGSKGDPSASKALHVTIFFIYYHYYHMFLITLL